MSDNPYQPPEAQTDVAVTVDDELASRWRRLFGAIIDSLILGGINFFYLFQSGQFEKMRQGIAPDFSQQLMSLAIVIGAFIVLNSLLLHTRGQTIGKLLLRTRIVKLDNQPASLHTILLLRYFPQWLVSMIPFIGGVLSIINVLFIFRADKRCVHDMIAGTRVVNANF